MRKYRYWQYDILIFPYIIGNINFIRCSCLVTDQYTLDIPTAGYAYSVEGIGNGEPIRPIVRASLASSAPPPVFVEFPKICNWLAAAATAAKTLPVDSAPAPAPAHDPATNFCPKKKGKRTKMFMHFSGRWPYSRFFVFCGSVWFLQFLSLCCVNCMRTKIDEYARRRVERGSQGGGGGKNKTHRRRQRQNVSAPKNNARGTRRN